jgi:small-conductance mechanosensitive channel
VPRSAWIAIVLLLALTPAAPAASQADKPAAAPAAESAPPEPQAYPLAEVSLRAQQTRRELEGIKERLEPSAAMQAIEKDLPARSKVIASAAKTTRSRLSSQSVPFSVALDLQREWETRRKSLDIWEDQITDRRGAVDRESARLAELTARWRLTREAASAADTKAAVETCQKLLAEIRAVNALVQKRATALAGLLGRLGEPSQLVADTTEAVRRSREDRRAQLFEADARPLWHVFSQVQEPHGVIEQVVADFDRERETLVAYVELRGPRIAQILLLGLAGLAGALALRRRLARWTAEDPSLDEAALLFRRPFSIALLVTLVVAALALPLAPEAVGDVVAWLLLVPALRLLPGLVPVRHRLAVWAVVGLVLASQIREAVSAAPIVSRLLLTAELVGALAFMGWLIRHAHADVPVEQRTRPAVAFGARALLALLMVGFLANLFGWVGLASLLLQGSVITSYAALIFYAAVRLVRGGIRLSLYTQPARQLRMVSRGAERIEATLGRLVGLLGFAAWVHVALNTFAVRDPLYAGIYAALTAKSPLGALNISLGDILAFAAVIAAAFYLARFIRFVLEEDVFPRFEWERGIPNAIATSAQYTVLIFGLLLALGAGGVDLSRITLLAGAFGVGIGFGLQNIVNNFVSGLILLFERPIQVGDTIEVQGLMGEVRRIGPRSSTVRSFDGAEVIVPNGTLISDNVVNWTLSDRRRRVILPLALARGSDPDQVLQILRDVADANETVLKDPGPLVRFCGYDDGALSFELRAWIPRFEEGFGVQTALWTDIERRFLAAGIQVPFPQRDVYVHGTEREAQP